MADRINVIAKMLADLCYFVPETGSDRKFEGCAAAIEADQALSQLSVGELKAATRYWISQLPEDRMPLHPPALSALRRAHGVLEDRKQPDVFVPDEAWGPVEGATPQGVPIRRQYGSEPLFLKLHIAFSAFCASLPGYEQRHRMPPGAAADLVLAWRRHRDEWEELLPTGSGEVRRWLDAGIDLEQRVGLMESGLPYVNPAAELGI